MRLGAFPVFADLEDSRVRVAVRVVAVPSPRGEAVEVPVQIEARIHRRTAVGRHPICQSR